MLFFSILCIDCRVFSPYDDVTLISYLLRDAIFRFFFFFLSCHAAYAFFAFHEADYAVWCCFFFLLRLPFFFFFRHAMMRR